MVDVNAAELERLIRDLNDPRNQAAPDQIGSIQRQIQSLQRETSAWQIGLGLLDHHESQMRFYGALTVTIKVNADWDVDNVGQDRELVNDLIQRLVTSYVKLSAIPDVAFVLLKLCTTLVAVFQKSDSAWAFPVRHVLACMVAEQYVPQEEIPEMDLLLATSKTLSGLQLKSLLMLASTIAEEAGATTNTAKGHNAEIRMGNNAPDVWKLIRFSIQSITETSNHGLHHDLVVKMDQDHGLDIARAAISLAPFWTQYVKTGKSAPRSEPQVVVDCFKVCMAAMCVFFEQSELSSSIIESFTALEQHHHRLLCQIKEDYVVALLNSQIASTWLNQLHSGDFDVEPSSYVEYLEALMNQADFTTPEYLTSGNFVLVLSQIQQLLRCDGVASVEDTACQPVLEILTSIAEGFNDWEEATPFDNDIRSLIRQVCRDCLQKIRLPESELSSQTQLWDSDDRARFQDFRYDVHDFLQNAFSTLGTEVVEQLVKGVVDTGNIMDWSKLEAHLFGLVAFSDTMNSEPTKFDQYLDLVFRCDAWEFASTSTRVPDRVRKVMIKLVGENAGFLERNKDRLVSSLNFLFESLQITTSATSASRAIFTLCDAQRKMLVEALPHFMSSLTTLSNLESDARSRIFGGVSAIIQALPSEEAKLQPLSSALGILDHDRQQLLDAKLEDADLRVKVTDIVWILATIGKGLRAPSEAPYEVEETRRDGNFWVEGPGQPIQQQALSIYHSLRLLIDGDSDSWFVEATCDFLKSAFTEFHPSPFKFSTPTNLEMLQRLIHLQNSLPDNVLGTASSYLASLRPQEHTAEFTTILATVLHQSQMAMTSVDGKMVHTEFCAAALEFYARALPRWAHEWLKQPNVAYSAQIMIELSLLLIQDPDTLPRRSAATFFTALFETSANSKVTMNQVTAPQMGNIMQTYAPRILAALVYLLGGECARSELESLTEPLKRLVQKQPLLAARTLKEVIREGNGVLTQRALVATKPEVRDRFAAQVIMLKGARKTNEIVREFWVACKGSSFGYVV